MTSANVYVVMGQCGEYSDHRSWGVKAFMNQVIAENFAFEATKEAKRIQSLGFTRNYDGTWLDENYASVEYAGNPFDPAVKTDYTGTDYYVLVVPLG